MTWERSRSSAISWSKSRQISIKVSANINKPTYKYYLYHDIYTSLIMNLETTYTFLHTTLPLFIGEFLLRVRTFRINELFTVSPLMMWVILQILIILIIWFVLRFSPQSWFSILLQHLFETMYDFFGDILWTKASKTTKTYILILFSLILLANLSSLVLDFVRIIFVDIESIYAYIAIPTADFSYTIALAIVWVIISLVIQFNSIGSRSGFFYEYIPFLWKKVIDIDQWDMSPYVYRPIKIIVRLFDIVISLFVWVLDIIWVVAKVISLSARLYGNMLAWWILLWILVLWVNWLTQSWFGVNFPIIWPIILYLQWLLVAVIQAFVFPLLVSIFIKIAQWEDEPVQVAGQLSDTK